MPETKTPARTDATGRLIREWNTQSEVPAPKRKPVTGIEPPAYRRDVFKGERRTEWDDWSRIFQLDKALSSAEKRAFHDIFAAEGGMKKAPGGSAVAGILQKTLDTIKSPENTPGIIARHGKNAKTTDLEMQDIKEAYKGFFNTVLSGPAKSMSKKVASKPVKGTEILGFVGNDKMASSVADILFREGTGLGSTMIMNAIKTTDPELDIGEDNVLGSKTVSALQEIAKDPRKTRSFLEFSANSRRLDEKARNDYFRFRDE